MTYQEYKAELLWIQVTEAEVSSSLNSIQREAIDCAHRYGERSVIDLLTDPSDESRMASYEGSIAYPFCCKAGDFRSVVTLFAGMRELASYRARLAHWFWNSQIGNPPVFAKAK